jgi:hypothetical protein
LEYLAQDRGDVTVQVLPFAAGMHGLMGAEVWGLQLPDASTVVYTENGYSGELIQETVEVLRLQRAYDAVRDMALSPAESQKFILRTLEEAPCDPSS